MSRNHPNARLSPSARAPLSRLVSLDFVRGFEAAARHLSFTAAGHELSLTQSAISRQIKALEASLGVTLFERLNRRLQLTAAGAEFHHAVVEALRTLDGAAARLRRHGDAGTLTVTTSMSFASLWLVPRLGEFRARRPDIDIRILADDRVLDAREHGVDVAIRFCDSRRPPAGALPLFMESAMPVCAPSLLRGRRLAGPAALSGHVLLQLETPMRSVPWLDWNQWLRAMGVADLRPAGTLRFSSYPQLVQAACEGAGIALGRVPLLQRHLDRGELVAPLGRRVAQAWQYVMLRFDDPSAREEVSDFVQWLLEQARERAVEAPSPRRRAPGRPG